MTSMDVVMPQLGETVKEGRISAWYKRAGDIVAAGDALFEMETDKTAMEVQALVSGRLSEIRVGVGETALVGSILAVISGEGARAASAPVAKADGSPGGRAALNADGAERSQRNTFGPFSEVQTPNYRYGRAKGPNGVRITPLARRIMAQNGIDPVEVAALAGRAPGDKIASHDVEAAIAARASSQPATTRAPEQPTGRSTDGAHEIVPLNRIRQETGRHLTDAWRTAPHVFQAIEIDFSAIVKIRDAQKEEFRRRTGASLSFLPFIARAACLALAAYPQINARLDGDRLLLSRHVHLGFAVDLGHDGLVAPVVRDADGMNVSGLALAIHRIIEISRSGRLTPADLDGGTYTISNNGSFGTLFTAPIINVPQVAILSMDAIRKKPVVVETEVGDVIVPRPVGVAAQCFDHRAFDGAYSAAFLSKLKEIIERRDWIAEFG